MDWTPEDEARKEARLDALNDVGLAAFAYRDAILQPGQKLGGRWFGNPPSEDAWLNLDQALRRLKEVEAADEAAYA